jgi:ligand-binding sensor domain-containing protein/signal transduction histidine kinase
MKKTCILAVLIAITIQVIGQKPTYYLNPDKNLAQYNYKRITTENGLPTNSLLYVHYSSEGYLWFSGYSGLIRYDGIKFTVFNNANTDAFVSNVVRNIAEDQTGNLWMTTQGSGLIQYSKGKFAAFGQEQEINHLYRGLLVDKQNRVWAASPDKGWFYFENGEFNFIEHSTPLTNIEVRAIVQSKTGAVWLATLGEGLYKYENGKLKKYSEKDGLINDWIYSLFVDENDNLWIGTNQGLCYYDGYKFHKALNEIQNTVNSISADRFGNMYIGTTNGLYRHMKYPRRLELVRTDNGLSNNSIIDLTFDMEGSLWTTHYKGGITCIKDGKFTNYTFKGGLPGRVVNTVFETPTNTLMVGFDNGSIIEIDNGKFIPYPLKTIIKGNRIRHVMADSKKNLWISTYFGLIKTLPNGTEILYSEENGFIDNQFRLTFEDSRNNIWVGSRNNGVLMIAPTGEKRAYNVTNGLLSNLVMTIEEDIKGNIWIGTSEGEGCLNKVTPDGIIHPINAANGFLSDIVFNIYPDANGDVWLATVNGLWRYSSDKFYNYTTRQGLADNSVYDIVEDNMGYLWLPFDNGVMKVNKEELLSIDLEANDRFNCRIYNKYDGMPNSECNPTSQALKGSNGLLYFPTLEGLSVIDPHDEIINNFVPPVIIEELYSNNTKIDLSGNMTFEPGNTRYTFHYTALSLYEPEQVKFRYILEGFDADWTETGQRMVSYTNLPHGDYTFQVAASNNDGVWNNIGDRLSFSIKPKFTETLFFFILLLVLSFSLVYIFYVWRITQLRKDQVELEEIVDRRTREVLDKNEALELLMDEVKKQNTTLLDQKQEIEKQANELQLQKEELKENMASKDKILSIISHDLRSPLGNIKNMLSLLIERKEQFDVKKRERILENLAEITKSTFYLLDNLLSWSRSQRGLINIDPQLFLVSPVFDEIINLTTHQSQKKKISVELNIDSSDLVYGDINMIKTVFRNLLENAVKFTPENGKVEVTRKTDNDYISFHFTDNGVGLTPEQIDNIMANKGLVSTFGTNREKGSGLGLMLCKDFIMKNGGKFNVKSVVGEGSTFTVSLKRFQI